MHERSHTYVPKQSALFSPLQAFFQGMRTAFWVMILLMLGLYIFAVLGEAIFNHDSAALQAELNARGHEVKNTISLPH